MFKDLKKPEDIALIKLKRSISNWTKTAKVIYDIHKNPEEVLLLLWVEHKTLNRKYNIKRLYSRFSHLRRTTEKANLKSLVKHLEPYGLSDGINLSIVTSNQFRLAMYLNHDALPISEILRVLKYELESSNRPYMIAKIYGKFQTTRQKQEYKRLKI